MTLCFDDEVTEIRRTITPVAWRDVIVLPGDTLEAHVLNNRTLRIKYGRAGRLGVFERREIEIHGYT